MSGTIPKQNWRLGDVPRLDGKVAIVTGATGGIGLETALGLARRGATTILAGRNADKGSQAIASIKREAPAAKVCFEMLDLASLASVARFADSVIAATGGRIDILVNNAGFMGSPTRLQTEDGFERQIGVNYLGHFALTGRLKDTLCAAGSGGRVVNVASLSHRRVSLDLDDLQSIRTYRPMVAYGRSKLALLVFSIELQRRATHNNWALRSIAAHPGWALTDIITNGMRGGQFRLKAWLAQLVWEVVAQPARTGALPVLYASATPEAEGGAYYGPARLGETRGSPALARIFPQAADPLVARRLWSVSQQLTGVSFD